MSQSLSALLRLRELILDGALAAGERLSEPAVALRLGASRTPVRAALAHLAEEGLVEPLPSGGFAVKSFTERELRDAIELRGTLEGLAARLAAERGAPAEQLDALGELLARLDAVFAGPELTAADFASYVTLNAQFHAALATLAESEVIARQLARVTALPFAAPSALVMAQRLLPQSRAMLLMAHDQHREVLAAIAAREGSRAEALMREHARLARRNLERVLRNQDSMKLVPGGALLRRRAMR